MLSSGNGASVSRREEWLVQLDKVYVYPRLEVGDAQVVLELPNGTKRFVSARRATTTTKGRLY